jgi:hypothetical protein
MTTHICGIDIGKTVFHLVGLSKEGHIIVDAEAIAEAVQRPTMRFVPIKNEAQLDLQALHRVRDRWIGRRTAVINQLRGFLLEHGITITAGPLISSGSFPPYWKTQETSCRHG